VLSAVSRRGHEVEDIRDLAGFSVREPALALALAVCMFSLMGFPPTAGLLGKVYIFSSAFSAGSDHAFAKPLVVLAVIGVINSAIAAAYYLRVVAACYNKPPTEEVQTQRTGGMALRWGLAACAAMMLILFIRPMLLTRSANTAATAVRNTPQAALAQANGDAVRDERASR